MDYKETIIERDENGDEIYYENYTGYKEWTEIQVGSKVVVETWKNNQGEFGYREFVGGLLIHEKAKFRGYNIEYEFKRGEFIIYSNGTYVDLRKQNGLFDFE